MRYGVESVLCKVDGQSVDASLWKCTEKRRFHGKRISTETY